MTLPFALPDWVPWWVPILVIVPALLYGLVFLFMPFSVIGVKGRLDSIEARLDEIQGEIRSLSLRLPEPPRGPAYEEPPSVMARPRAERGPAVVRPPIPPAPRYPGHEDEEDYESARPARLSARRPDPDRDAPRPRRSEPRLGWPP
jgi:hypothetical protein